MTVNPLIIHLPNFDPGIWDGIALHVRDLSMKMRDGSNSRCNCVINTNEIVIGILRKLVWIKWPLGHWRRDCKSFSEGARHSKQSSRAKNSTAEKFTAMAIGAG